MTNQKGIKRLSVILVVAMLLSLIPATLGFAAEVNTAKVEAFVTRLYDAALDREPDAGGLKYWTDVLANGKKNAAQVIDFWMFVSPEFAAKNLTNDQFLDVAYKTFFDRAADADGKAYWLGEIAKGASRRFVVAAMISAPTKEFQNLCKEAGIVRGGLGIKETDRPFSVKSVSAVKANEIKVVFNKAVASASFEVKMGSFIVPVAAATWNEAKTEATIVKSFGNYIAGDYTVTAKGANFEVVGATKIEDEKVTKIEITSSALTKTADNKQATANYKVYNQYNQDITKGQSILGVSSLGSVSAVDGVATVTKPASAEWASTDTVGSLTLYIGTVNTSATLNLVAAKAVKKVTLGEMVLPTDTVRLAPATGETINDVQIKYQAVDQYGNSVVLDDTTGLTFIYGNGIVNNSARVITKSGTTEKILVVNVSSVTAPTTATLSVIVNNTGEVSTISFNVYPVADIADFTLAPDNKVIKAGTPYKVWIEAVDTYGSVVKADTLPGMSSKFSIVTLNKGVADVNETIQYDSSVKKAYIEVDPKTAGQVTNLIVTLKANAKSITLPINVNKASEIVSMSLSGSSFTFANGGSSKLKATFMDQYGEKVSDLTGYTVNVVSDNVSVIEPDTGKTVAQMVAGISLAPKASQQGKSATLTVSLVKTTGSKTVDQQSVSINVISDNTTLTYAVSDVPVLHGLSSGSKDSDYAKEVTVTAKTSAGTTVYVPNTVITDITSTNESLVKLEKDSVSGKWYVYGLAAGISSGNQATATINVIVENFDGTVMVAPKTVTVSKDSLAAVTLKAFAMDGETELTEATTKFMFVAEDQYGVEMSNYITYVITNNTAGATVATTGDTITWTGANTAKSFNVTAITKNGIFLTVKVNPATATAE